MSQFVDKRVLPNFDGYGQRPAEPRPLDPVGHGALRMRLRRLLCSSGESSPDSRSLISSAKGATALAVLDRDLLQLPSDQKCDGQGLGLRLRCHTRIL